MKLGFIGTGTITEAMITGLIGADYPISEFLVSARGKEVSDRLTQKHETVQVFAENQAIIDGADMVVLAVRPQVAHKVLSPLQFPADKPVISLIAALSGARLHEWIGQTVAITRATPLPSVAEGNGVTAIYAASPVICDLFDAIGTVVIANSVEEYNTYAVASATMGTYFGFLNTVAQWMHTQGVDAKDAKTYLARLFDGLSQTTLKSGDQDFEALRLGHSTPGGVNQQVYEVFAANGGLDALNAAFGNVLTRIEAGFD